MRRAERFSGVAVVTYAVLDNHFHMVLHVPGKNELDEMPEALFWKRLGSLYSKEQIKEIQATLASFQEINPGSVGMAQAEAYRQGFMIACTT